jgi:hypothetical protein
VQQLTHWMLTNEGPHELSSQCHTWLQHCMMCCIVGFLNSVPHSGSCAHITVISTECILQYGQLCMLSFICNSQIQELNHACSSSQLPLVMALRVWSAEFEATA